MSKALTISVAKTYMDNYKGISDPRSMSYGDGHALNWLIDEAKRYPCRQNPKSGRN